MKQMPKSIQFIILICAVSWTIAGVAILLGLHEAKGLIYTVFASGYMLLPAACVILLQIIHKEKPLHHLGLSFRLNGWFLVAGIVPIVTVFLAFGINLLFPDVSFSAGFEGLLPFLTEEQAAAAAEQFAEIPPVVFILAQIVNALIAGYTINAFFALGEEIGWRGYLLKALRGKKLLPVSLLIGIVWGLWHFPLILLGHNYPQHPVAGVGMMVIFCILLTPTMIYIVIKSKSVLTAAIFHGTLNAISGISLLFLVGGNDLTNGITGIAGFAALLLMNLAFCLYDKYFSKENIFTKAIGEY